jgi:DNA replication licensing factor MCM2
VVAAANPIGGIYRVDRNFNDNVELTDPILSRFDILTVIKDIAEPAHDDMLATFVINSHMRNHPGQRAQDPAKREQNEKALAENLLDESGIVKPDTSRLLSMSLLRKYIIYARKFVHPRLNDIDKEKITEFYARIRQASSAVGGIPIAVRHIESVLRMSEGHAKMHLRDYVRPDDIDFAINMLLDSFLQTQKASVARALSKKFEAFKKKPADTNALLLHLLGKLARERAIYLKYQRGIEESERLHVEIPLAGLQHGAQEFGVSTIQRFFTSPEFMKEYKLVDGKTIRTVMEI